MQAIVRHAFGAGIKRCYVHALLDGRDVGVQSAITYTEKFEKLFTELNSINIIDYLILNYGANTLPFVHQIKGFIDLLKWHFVSN